MLQSLETVDARGKVSRLHTHPSVPIGQQLQSMRRLASQDLLVTHTTQASRKPLHFISYRIIDGTSCAFMKTSDLVQCGEVVFWDRWCLPRRLAERREVVSHAALDRYLMEKLKHSDVVWGIESPKYAELKSYSAKEQQAAIAQGSYRKVPFGSCL